MKNKTKTQLTWTAIAILFAIIGYMWYNPQVVEVPVEVPVPMPPPRLERSQERRRAPEFREPPIKQYKPGHMQQMGLLVGEGEEPLPLYGKEERLLTFTHEESHL